MNYFKRLLGKDKKKGFMFTSRNLAEPTSNGDRIRSFGSGAAVVGSFDSGSFLTISDAIATSSNPVSKSVPTDDRKAVEPKEVFEEIKTESPKISFDNLAEKIRVVEERINVLKEHLPEDHLGDEHRTLFYLRNRLKYLKTQGSNPLNWAITTRDAVTDLCKRYKLRVVPLKQYYTLVPKEGIKEMSRYTKAYKAITGDAPIFELVIKDTEPKSEQRKKDRDPILLANSPLSNTLFIIGAWDDEVEIVDEIIYGMK